MLFSALDDVLTQLSNAFCRAENRAAVAKMRPSAWVPRKTAKIPLVRHPLRGSGFLLNHRAPGRRWQLVVRRGRRGTKRCMIYSLFCFLSAYHLLLRRCSEIGLRRLLLLKHLRGRRDSICVPLGQLFRRTCLLFGILFHLTLLACLHLLSSHRGGLLHVLQPL